MSMLKRYIRGTLAATFLLLYSAGCGGGGESSNFSSPNTTSEVVADYIQMEIGRPYTMHRGESIVKETDGSVVLIETDTETGVTTATLQSGRARIESN